MLSEAKHLVLSATYESEILRLRLRMTVENLPEQGSVVKVIRPTGSEDCQPSSSARRPREAKVNKATVTASRIIELSASDQ
jgi:hypothetical protein